MFQATYKRNNKILSYLGTLKRVLILVNKAVYHYHNKQLDRERYPEVGLLPSPPHTHTHPHPHPPTRYTTLYTGLQHELQVLENASSCVFDKSVPSDILPHPSPQNRHTLQTRHLKMEASTVTPRIQSQNSFRVLWLVWNHKCHAVCLRLDRGGRGRYSQLGQGHHTYILHRLGELSLVQQYWSLTNQGLSMKTSMTSQTNMFTVCQISRPKTRKRF